MVMGSTSVTRYASYYPKIITVTFMSVFVPFVRASFVWRLPVCKDQHDFKNYFHKVNNEAFNLNAFYFDKLHFTNVHSAFLM